MVVENQFFNLYSISICIFWWCVWLCPLLLWYTITPTPLLLLPLLQHIEKYTNIITGKNGKSFWHIFSLLNFFFFVSNSSNRFLLPSISLHYCWCQCICVLLFLSFFFFWFLLFMPVQHVNSLGRHKHTHTHTYKKIQKNK